VVVTRRGPAVIILVHNSAPTAAKCPLLPERAKTVATRRATRRAPDQLHTANAMNEDQIKGQWEQLKGKFKRAWAELTDDDFLRAEGSIDKMYGIIQERFGDTRDDIRKKLDQT
jgi:uncharacterized protein YjbJ (UPF0337 family)